MERKGVALLSGEHVQNPHSFGHWMCGKPNQEKKIEMFLSIQWRKKKCFSLSLSLINSLIRPPTLQQPMEGKKKHLWINKKKNILPHFSRRRRG